jgi:hypothetical protein
MLDSGALPIALETPLGRLIAPEAVEAERIRRDAAQNKDASADQALASSPLEVRANGPRAAASR